MLKILKNLKESLISVIIIVILLCLQAGTDLALPDYTSKIVNIGIQQGGIQNVSPEAIRKEQMENLLLFSTDDERAKIVEGCTKAGIGCIECKKILINNIENFICPIREKKKALDKEIENIDEFLAPSQKKANDVAAELMVKVRNAIKI